jgi:tetratricopeptide (TPR) repeat protein
MASIRFNSGVSVLESRNSLSPRPPTDSNRAITDFTQAIQFGPSYVEAYNNRGLSYDALDRRAEAIADFRKAQSIDAADRVSKQQLRMLGF